MKNIFKAMLATLLIIMQSLCLGQTNQFSWKQGSPKAHGFSPAKLEEFKDSLVGRGTKKLIVIHQDEVILKWFADGFDDTERTHYVASLSKSVVSGLSLMLAIQDGLIQPDAPACRYIESLKKDGLKSKITIRQLATHTSGIEDAKLSVYEEDSLKNLGFNTHQDLPGWKGQFWRKEPDPFSVTLKEAPVTFTPGSAFAYSNPGVAILNYAVTSSLKDSEYGDIRSYLEDRLYEPMGIPKTAYQIGYGMTYELDGLSLVPGWGGGNFTADALVRIGQLLLHNGNWEGQQLVDSSIVNYVTSYNGTALPGSNSLISSEWTNRSDSNPVPASTLGWYNNFDGVWGFLPRDAFCGAGAQGQILLVIPSLDLVMVRLGAQLKNDEQGEQFWGAVEKHLLNPLILSRETPPYPQSDMTMTFSSADEVISLAKGSDNWPITWGPNNTYYTAYGDGWGFERNSDIKLSLGMAKVTGRPPNITGQNIYSNSIDQVGQGRFGAKASGILMVEDTLYMLIRNVDNSQLVWSNDFGKSWNWASWKFENSFGCPTFLNYGENYLDAKDGYVYIYSHDDASAYLAADQMVMARVDKYQLKDWRAYEYYSGLDQSGNPVWEDDIRKREPVFENPGRCYRSGITYNKGLDKYMWVHLNSISDIGPRFEGSIGIYLSERPWGPWETLYYSPNWDIGPGETASIPTFWLSDNGRSGYLLSSSNDEFSLRGFKIK